MARVGPQRHWKKKGLCSSLSDMLVVNSFPCYWFNVNHCCSLMMTLFIGTYNLRIFYFHFFLYQQGRMEPARHVIETTFFLR